MVQCRAKSPSGRPQRGRKQGQQLDEQEQEQAVNPEDVQGDWRVSKERYYRHRRCLRRRRYRVHRRQRSSCRRRRRTRACRGQRGGYRMARRRRCKSQH
ncbi:protamine-2 [Hyaena hyaena]|uniref:protamine-2 n=1 Tax=Hyaena hyaena TaxID=95912 RepID=UPI0019209869|nr:protamine-2 [Hyaena hyaena]